MPWASIASITLYPEGNLGYLAPPRWFYTQGFLSHNHMLPPSQNCYGCSNCTVVAVAISLSSLLMMLLLSSLSLLLLLLALTTVRADELSRLAMLLFLRAEPWARLHRSGTNQSMTYREIMEKHCAAKRPYMSKNDW